MIIFLFGPMSACAVDETQEATPPPVKSKKHFNHHTVASLIQALYSPFA